MARLVLACRSAIKMMWCAAAAAAALVYFETEKEATSQKWLAPQYAFPNTPRTGKAFGCHASIKLITAPVLSQLLFVLDKLKLFVDCYPSTLCVAFKKHIDAEAACVCACVGGGGGGCAD